MQMPLNRENDVRLTLIPAVEKLAEFGDLSFDLAQLRRS
jgi:hypothetical protein